MKARQLIEIDMGGAPDWVDPEKKRRIQTHGHPYAENPAYPKEGSVAGKSYAQSSAAETYPALAKKIQQLTGGRARNPNDLVGAMQNAYQKAVQYEQGHKEQLEQMAIEVVLSLPEFHLAKAAYDSGDLELDVELVSKVDLSGSSAEPEEPEEEQQAELQVAQVAKEMDIERHKRRFVNLLIQGAAINKNHAYQLVSDQLNRINPQLVNTYAILMTSGELLYWILPEEAQKAMYGSGAGAAGKAHMEFEEESGKPVIHAHAVVFPVLIQELVKGLMEYLSYSEEDPGTQKHVYGQEDTLGNETWDIMMGPAAWKQVLKMIGDDQRMMPYVYRHLLDLPTSEFNAMMQEVLKGTPKAKAYLQDVMKKIAQEQQESTECARELVNVLLEQGLDAKLPILQQQFPELKDQIVAIAEFDPSPTKKYLTWILRMAKKGGLRFPEDGEKTLEALKGFADLAKKPTFQFPKDVNQYKSFADLASAVESSQGIQTKGEEYRGNLEAGTEELYNTPPYRVLKITTPEAMAKYGRNSKWCVKDPHWFTYYKTNHGTDAYYLIYKNDQPYVLLDPKSGQMKDVQDSAIRISVGIELHDLVRKHLKLA